jgi:hypothetical protein
MKGVMSFNPQMKRFSRPVFDPVQGVPASGWHYVVAFLIFVAFVSFVAAVGDAGKEYSMIKAPVAVKVAK